MADMSGKMNEAGRRDFQPSDASTVKGVVRS